VKYEAPQVEKIQLYIDDPNGYLTGLPMPERKGKVRGRNLFMTKEQRLELKIQRAVGRGNRNQADYNRLIAIKNAADAARQQEDDGRRHPMDRQNDNLIQPP
jgi:hypothetical protein